MNIALIAVLVVLLFTWVASRSRYTKEDEWVHVRYKDTTIPMRAWQKEFEWDRMSGEEKRNVYLKQKKMIEKGEVRKVKVDGGFLLEPTKKSSKAKKEAINYNKNKQ